jgi:hypothetical protein
MALSFRPLDLVLLTFPRQVDGMEASTASSASPLSPTSSSAAHILHFAKSFQATSGLDAYLPQLERALRDMTRLQHVVGDTSWPHVATCQCLEVGRLPFSFPPLPLSLSLSAAN